MNIYDLFEEDHADEDGYQDVRNDQSTLKLDDSRKTRVTLAHINQLRQSHDVRKLEHEKKLGTLATQYKPAEEGGGPPL